MQRPNGFTLIEIVSVLVILGVLAFATASAFLGNDATGAFVERDKLRSALIHARAQGMARGGGQCVAVTANGVSFPTSGTAAMPSQLRDYAFSVKANGATNFCFDASGSVCTSVDLTPREDTDILYCKASSGTTSISFGNGASLSLDNATGFIQ